MSVEEAPKERRMRGKEGDRRMDRRNLIRLSEWVSMGLSFIHL